MKMKIKETSLVKPSKETPSKILWNSNLDLLFTLPVLSVYFYKPTNNNNNFFDTRIMKEALSKVLVSFYPVAGRLIWGMDNNGKGKRIETNCNGEGVLFVEATSDDTCIDDFGDFVPNMEMRKLIPNVDTSVDDISSFPLAFFQVTRFKCGGVCLGVGISHVLVDGVSGIHFINSWSEIARGLSVSAPPFIDRSLVRARDPPMPAFEHVEYQPLETLNKVPESSTTAMLKITRDQLTLLKERSEHKGSTFEVLAAHVWRSMSKARGLDDDQLTKLKVNTDGRPRLVPPLPQEYFGNFVFTALPMAKSGELQSEPLAKTARRIHDAIARMDDEYLRSAIDYLELNRSNISPLTLWPRYPNPNLRINSWIKMPVYEADFGWGKPIHMGPARPMNGGVNEGSMFVLPGPNDDKSLRMLICVDSDHMTLFQKYLYEF